MFYIIFSFFYFLDVMREIFKKKLVEIYVSLFE